MPTNPFSRDPAVTVAVGADTSRFGSAIDGAIASLGSFSKAVGAAGAALGALGVTAFAKATRAAADFESAMVEVEKVTDPQVAAAMSTEIREMARTIPLAQEELAGLAADAARFGIRGTENLRSFSEAAAKMATATDLSATEAGENFARLATLTKTPVSEIENLGSAINSLSNNFATSSSEIVDSMLRSSAALSQFGLSQTEIAGLSAALNEVSESSRRAGTRLRRLIQEIMNPKKVDNLAGALGMTATEFKRMRREAPLQLLRQMVQAFVDGGTEAENLRKNLSTTSRQALAGLAQNLEGLNRALGLSAEQFRENTSLQREFDAATDTFNTRLQLFRNRLNNIAITIGNLLLPSLTSLLERVQPILDRIQQLANNMTEAQARIASMGSVVAAVAGTVAFFASGPLGALIAAVGVLGIAFQENFLGIRDVVNSIIPVLRDVFTDIATRAERIASIVREEFTPAFERAKTIVMNVVGTIQQVWDQRGGQIMTRIRSIVGLIETSLIETIRFLGPIVRDVLGRIQQFWNEHGRQITNVVFDVIIFALDQIEKGIRSLRTAISVVLDIIEGDWSGAWETIKETALSIWNDLTSFFGEGGEGSSAIRGAIQFIVTKVKEIWSGAWETIEQTVKDFIGGIVEWLRGIGKDDVVAAAAFIGRQTAKNIKKWWNLNKKIGKIIKDFIAGIVTWLKEDAKGDMVAAAEFIARSWWENTKKWFNLNKKIGLAIKDFFAGIVTWLKEDAKEDIRTAFEVLWEAAKAATKAFFDELFYNSMIKDLFSDIGTWLKETAASALETAMEEVASSMEDGLETFDPSSVMDDLQGIIDKADSALGSLEDIPSNVTTTITRVVNTVTSGGGGGGGGTSTGVRGRDRDDLGGGSSLRGSNSTGSRVGFQHGGFIPGGREIAAMLHGPEWVLNEGQMAALVNRTAAAGATSGGVTIHQENHIEAGDASGVERGVTRANRRLLREIKAHR